jgi:molybdate transport system ATP-binding protein
VADHAQARPRALSGGQAQRVALARALATEPRALLLDEPLAALDVATRVEVRRDLRRHLATFAGPTVLVTHDPVDDLALADHVVVLEAGRATQSGTIAEVTSRPRTRYVADLIGTNLVHGTATTGTVTTDSGAVLIVAEGGDGPVSATVAPAAVALHRREPEGSPRNRWATTVAHLDLLGDRVRGAGRPPAWWPRSPPGDLGSARATRGQRQGHRDHHLPAEEMPPSAGWPGWPSAGGRASGRSKGDNSWTATFARRVARC